MKALPLLTVSTEQARAIIAHRAEQLLRLPPSVDSGKQQNEEEEISCTPSFGSSSLAKEMGHQAAVVIAGGEKGCPEQWETQEDLLLVSDEERRDGELYTEGKNEFGGIQQDPLCSNSEKEMNVGESSSHELTDGGNTLGAGVAEAADSLRTSYVEEFQSVTYPTLWQLGSSELTSDHLNEFYVPALSSMVTPCKVSYVDIHYNNMYKVILFVCLLALF